ncbi:TPA: CDP-diacylglycerol--serine O-phosphatidyltransferase [Candidatus Woesearchaeota archaeon]|nr:CDP-diacylglycerol--serine O-phosphatidyltransferase [Candidatus Woesearchaeota archaeon]
MGIADNFSIFKEIEFPSLLTLLNGISGMICILFAISKQYTFAAVFLLVAVFFDFIDGKLARVMKKETPLGLELDSLCDVVSFGVAPVVLAYQTTMSTLGQGAIFAGIIYMLYFCAGSLRLARFNITKQHKYYEGMPITINGTIVPILFFAGLTKWYPLWFLISAVLMISAFKLKKFI